jgi:hypothetical protein
MENSLNLLSRKSGFNTALRHFKIVNEYVAEMNRGGNLADLINASLDDGRIQRYQIRAILSSLLIDKFAYKYRTENLVDTVEDVSNLRETIEEWTNIDFVVAYSNPHAGLYIVNPLNESSWEPALPLTKDELLVVYAGAAGKDVNDSTLENAVEDFYKLLYGSKLKGKKEYKGGARKTSGRTTVGGSGPVSARPETAKQPEPEKPAAEKPQAKQPSAGGAGGGKRRITPQYAVNVTNELFHNGNVEAWKKIIESYKAKHPGLDVLIWYENERINDINALFKWGKVKHGTPIMFSVAGENIKDVSKLQRYLFEGASPRFEAFLHGGVDRTLDLF